MQSECSPFASRILSIRQYRNLYCSALNTFLLCLMAVGLQVITPLPSAFAQQTKLSVPERNNDGTYSYISFTNDPLNLRIYTLKNGMTVFLVPNRSEPRISTLISVRAGSKNDPADATGLAHYLEHMLFKGTDKYGSLDFAKEKPLLDKIEQVYEQYRATKDDAVRTVLYRAIDSLSGLAAKYAIPNEYDKMVSEIGASGTNAHTYLEETVYENTIPSNQLEAWLTLESERFRNPILRLFHTELEAVYEEKNRTLDNDGRQARELLMASVFPTHPYGTQTTIGTVEHLKNPSMKKIREYYQMYYVPNNMAITLAGDLDPEETIKMIDKHFSSFKPKDVPPFSIVEKSPITAPIIREVFGPSAESAQMAFRFPGAGSREIPYLVLCDMILSNSATGLIDVNIKQKQKALNASCTPNIHKDYSLHLFFANPRKGQKSEEVIDLLLAQIEELKKGNFSEDILPAIITNLEIENMRSMQDNDNRAERLSEMFIKGLSWEDELNFTAKLRSITKQQLVEFANKWYNNNYVVVYKRVGENKNIQRVPKPQITPVTINRDVSSPFLKQISSLVAKSEKINPRFTDFNNDFGKAKAGSRELFAVKNTENELFTLQFIWDLGSRHDKKTALAMQYMDVLGTNTQSNEQIKRALYGLGCTMTARSSNDQCIIEVSGVQRSMNSALDIMQNLLTASKPDATALQLLVDGIIKQRNDMKKNRAMLLNQALTNYAMYGKRNPTTDILSENQLRAVTANELCDKLRQIVGIEHRITYYGTLTAKECADIIQSRVPAPASLSSAPSAEPYTFQDNSDGGVLFLDYPMVQAEVVLRLKTDAGYNPKNAPYSRMINEYLGGMSGIVFTTIRESRALAYASDAYYTAPRKKNEPYYMSAYIGTQADKLPEAVSAMNEILTGVPKVESTFENARKSIISTIESERLMRGMLFTQLENYRRLGLDYDVRMDVYEKVKTITFDEMKKFIDDKLNNKKFVYMVVGSKTKVSMDELKKFGQVREVTVEEILGY